MNDLVEAFDRLCRADWNAFDETAPIAERFLREHATDSQVIALLEALPHRDGLATLCENLASLRKLVLMHDPTSGVRLRLHLFLDDYDDMPHNHRWSFASRVLSGALDHRIYGSDAAAADHAVLRCAHRAGDIYSLHHSMSHTLTAASATMTLVLRGPSERDTATWRSRTSGESWQNAGGKADRRKSDMTLDEIVTTCADARTLLTLSTERQDALR